MFKKVLIANRGEIALRVIRACRELGIATVAVHSEADEDSLHVRFADEAICIGPARGTDSYLKADRIISAAEITGAEAIHPGYGFLSENAEFADMCASHGFKFIGPAGDVIRKMGDKAQAKQTMIDADVPVVPGNKGVIKDVDAAKKLAAEMGYPVILKAVSGGGGRGMRIVDEESEFDGALSTASAEAAAAFNNPDMYMEKFIRNPRHIEIQLMADQHGTTVHLGERECSIQRRHQKLIEEAPSAVVSPQLREKMGSAAVKGAKMVGYEGAGTIEFLLDADENFYFMEMNTRIQVEHPVTELVFGKDLVKDQIRVAAGEKLGYEQKDLILEGHAIECRINAEDWTKNFMPNPGEITSYHMPGGPGVRVDSHAYQRYKIPPFYDSLIAKLICYGKTREEAILRLKRALNEIVIEGVTTTVGFHEKLIARPEFVEANFDTGFLEKVNILDD